jgi:hypothetical protein
MKSHRQFVRRLRRLVIGLAVIAVLVPAGASADARVGDTPADFPGASRAPGVGLNAAARVGDTPADFPGATRAPDVAPPTIQVVRPQRTIVRDVNEVLPIALSGAALLIVLMGAAFVLVRVRVERRHAVGRSH